MAAPTVYKWDDPGAPVLDSSNNSTRAQQVLDLIKACLVDGYGAKAGAGWTAFDDRVSNSRVMILQQGGTGFAVNAMVRFDTGRMGINGAGAYQIDAAESYTDILTPVGAFANPTRNLNNTNHYGSYVWARYTNTSGYPCTWMMIANERTFYLWFGRHSKTTSLPADTSSTHQDGYSGFYGGSFFGDYENAVPGFQYNQMFIENEQTAYTTDHPRTWSMLISGMDGVGGRYALRAWNRHARYFGGGPSNYTSYKVCTFLPYMESTPAGSYEGPRLGYGWGALTYPYPENNELFLEKVGIGLGGVIHGYWPGLHQTLHSNYPSTWYPDTFQGTGDFAGQEFIIVPQYRGKLIIRIDADWNSLGV